MNPKFKYWLEDNKDKLYIGAAGVALVGLLAGGYFLLNKDHDYQPGDTVGISMADFVIAQRGDGDSESVDVDTKEGVHVLDLSLNALLFRGDNLDTLFVYQDNGVFVVEVEKNGEMKLSQLFSTEDYGEIQSAAAGGGNFALQSADKLVILNTNGEPVLLFEDNKADVYHLADKGIYLSIDDEIHFVDYEKGDTKYVDMGDKTTKFSQHSNTIVARNDFGKGKDIETILNITDGNLYIDSLRRLKHDEKVDVTVPRNENQLVFIQTTTDKEGKLTRQDLSVLGVATEVEDEEEVNLNAQALPLDTVEPFSSDKTIATRGFLYDWTETGLRIIEMRNGREVTRLDVEADSPQLFVPVYMDK